MIVGTAGHIDHGKSTLVTALTGRAMDRLAEERRRGITIDLNFAPLELPGRAPVGIVDVPGHEDLVRTMVAGATGIDLLLLVVDLTEGMRPQTEEHLAVAEQLRIRRGIPVFTKADLVDAEWAEAVIADLMPRLARSCVEFGPPAVVSARTGQGVDELRRRLAQEAEGPVAARGAGRFRMPVDRSFSLAGVGTVITGTVWSGAVRVGDTVRLLPTGRIGRVRSIESYGSPVPVAEAGSRAALGVSGVDREAVGRGEVALLEADRWEPTVVFDAEVELLNSAPRPLVTRSRVRINAGTAELLARLYPRGVIAPGSAGLARVALEGPAVLAGGDRFVIRGYSPVTTIGGGRVLDAVPPRKATWTVDLAAADPGARLQALVARRRQGVRVEDLPQLLGAGVPPQPGPPGIQQLGDRLFSRATAGGLEQLALEVVAAHHRAAPDQPGISLETLRRSLRVDGRVADAVIDGLVDRGRLSVRAGAAALPGFTAAVEGGDAAIGALASRLETAGLEPPTVAELATDLGVANPLPLLRRAAEDGRIVAVAPDRYFSASAVAEFRKALLEVGATGPIIPAALRERLGLSRKFMIPLLEWADRQGITRRQGDTRVLVDSGR